MFSVLFEVQPKPEKWDEYLGNAKMLRPELEQIEGFVENIRYKSMQREGWILSLSSWRDEKSAGALAQLRRTIISSSKKAATTSLKATTCVSARYLPTTSSRRGCSF